MCRYWSYSREQMVTIFLEEDIHPNITPYVNEPEENACVLELDYCHYLLFLFAFAYIFYMFTFYT